MMMVAFLLGIVALHCLNLSRRFAQFHKPYRKREREWETVRISISCVRVCMHIPSGQGAFYIMNACHPNKTLLITCEKCFVYRRTIIRSSVVHSGIISRLVSHPHFIRFGTMLLKKRICATIRFTSSTSIRINCQLYAIWSVPHWYGKCGNEVCQVTRTYSSVGKVILVFEWQRQFI